jgi:transketolase
MTDRAEELQKRSRRIRRLILETIAHAGAGHTGGSLSVVEILTVLYFRFLKVDPENPSWAERDRFVLSKGHASPALYCTLVERGYFPKEKLLEFDRVNGMLQGHPCMRKTPGVDMSAGSLGQGLSCGIGMALGGLAKQLDFRVYVLLGCGELQEGQVWEAARYAGVHGLDGLTAIVDYNRVQLSGTLDDTLAVEPLAEKWRAFGWEVLTCDGHSIRELVDTIGQATQVKGRPQLIVARTVKGKGVSFMEGRYTWHAKAPTSEELEKALAEGGEDG